MMAESTSPLLQLDGISKSYGSTKALRNVSLHLDRGEALALIGENGAGKSTLMKVLAGVVAPDQGKVLIDGQSTRWSSPGDAIETGIALIHQELNLHDNLSVAENLFLGREPLRRWSRFFPLVDQAELARKSQEALERVGLNLSPQTPVASLPIATKQLVEIARALATNARVVIMDEPTSSLSDEDATRLLGLIRRLQDEGVAVIYISHRLHEIQQIADRVEVMRDGQHVKTLLGDQIDRETMVRAMVGRDLAAREHQSGHGDVNRAIHLQVRNLKVEVPSAPAISFDVRSGEVVALVGLVGSGRSEILETIFGIRQRCGGEVLVKNQPVNANTQSAIRAGLALVPEDRKITGLLIESDVRDNTTLAAMKSRGHLLSRSWQQVVTTELIDRLKIKTSSSTAVVGSLSGGNQQKVALAKWLATDSTVLMLDEPTRGVDIGAKAEIYGEIDRLAESGKAILVVSSEMEEVFAIADRVLVVADGSIAGELSRNELTEEAMMRLAVSEPVAAN